MSLLRVQTTKNIGTDSRAEMYASRRLLAPSNTMSKKGSEVDLHNLLHTKSMTSAKKTFTFSTAAGNNGKLPQLIDDNVVAAGSPAAVAVVNADSDESEDDEEEMDEDQAASQHTVTASTTKALSDGQKSPGKAISLREKSRTVTFPSNLLQDAEEKAHAPITESTSKQGGVTTKSKTSKNSTRVNCNVF